MAEAREIVSTEVKIHELVHRLHEDSGNDAQAIEELDISVCSFPPLASKETPTLSSPIPDCVHGSKPGKLIPSKCDKPERCTGTLAQQPARKVAKPQWKPFVSNFSITEQADERMFIFKPHRQKVNPSNQKPKRNDSSKPEQMNQKIDVSKSNPRKIPLLRTPNTPKSGGDSYKLNPEAKEFKPAWITLPSVVSNPEQNDNNTCDANSTQRNIPLLRNPLDPNSGAKECKSASLLRASECPNGKTQVPEINSRNVDTAPNFDLQTDINDTLKLNPSTCEEKPKERLFSSVLRSTEYTNNKTDVPKRNFEKIDPALKISTGRADYFYLNCCTNQLESEWVSFPASLSLSTYEKQKSAAPIIDSGKMDALCDFELPKGLGDSAKLKSCTGQLKPQIGDLTSVLSECEPTDKKTAVFKENSETIQTGCDVNLPKTYADSLKLKLCTHLKGLKQNISNAISCSETVAAGQSTLSEQDRQAIPAADTPIVYDNHSDQFSTECSEAKIQLGNVNTELIPEASLPQHFQTTPEKTLARFFRRNTLWLDNPDTNTLHDNTVNNGSSFHHGGDLPQNLNIDVLLPETLRELDSDEGPVTPRLYKSQDDCYVWEWPHILLPKSGEFGGDDTWRRSSGPLPKLEMTVLQFVNMVNHNFKETVITGTEDSEDEELSFINRMPTYDDSWMFDDGSDARDQLFEPDAATGYGQHDGGWLSDPNAAIGYGQHDGGWLSDPNAASGYGQPDGGWLSDPNAAIGYGQHDGGWLSDPNAAIGYGQHDGRWLSDPKAASGYGHHDGGWLSDPKAASGYGQHDGGCLQS